MPTRTKTVRQTRRAPVRYAWCPASDRENTLAVGTTQSADLLASMGTDMGRETAPGMVIERIIGNLTIDGATAADEAEWTAGIRVKNEGEATASLPILDTEIGRWLWWNGGKVAGADEIAAGVFKTKVFRYEFDVHGRWRLDDVGDELVMVIINHSSEASIIWNLWTRTLLRIP